MYSITTSTPIKECELQHCRSGVRARSYPEFLPVTVQGSARVVTPSCCPRPPLIVACASVPTMMSLLDQATRAPRTAWTAATRYTTAMKAYVTSGLSFRMVGVSHKYQYTVAWHNRPKYGRILMYYYFTHRVLWSHSFAYRFCWTTHLEMFFPGCSPQ